MKFTLKIKDCADIEMNEVKTRKISKIKTSKTKIESKENIKKSSN